MLGAVARRDCEADVLRVRDCVFELLGVPLNQSEMTPAIQKNAHIPAKKRIVSIVVDLFSFNFPHLTRILFVPWVF